MKIAISTEGDMVSMHFGRCPSFTIVEIESGKVISKSSLNNPGHEPGAIPKFLNENGVNCIVAGGMGMRAQVFFKEFNIQTVLGADGKIEDVIEKLREGTLEGGESSCKPGAGKGYGLDKTECDHPNDEPR
ncbi:MAG: NifB/NifX family molybdenum-iron cluster-binding protein [Elusimicrobiales bacterium]|nr:NifB/NifX family molybdenum-iron cluster-binding protein [Elusimicrobiales bacterium]MCK5106265.1 NifB/NifX family molybdenum-iron cluster-binding protein [Elusimicrobiales bacterium]